MFFQLSLILLIIIIGYLKFVYSYWSRNGYPHIKPTIPFGNLYDCTFGKSCMGVNLYDLYKSTTEPFIGIYLYFRPALLIRDADLVKRILVTDFNSFSDRGMHYDPTYDYMSVNLMALPLKSWRSLRQKLSPTFTAGKLKGMIPKAFSEVINLETYLDESAEQNKLVDLKDLYIRFALNIIVSVGFGIDDDTIWNPESRVREIEKLKNGGSFLNCIRIIGTFLCPPLLSFLKLHSNDPEVSNFFRELVRETILIREDKNIVRNDFIQNLLELRNPDAKKSSREQSDHNINPLTIEDCAAQALLFYAAGFETTAFTVVYTLFELAQNPTLLAQLRDEIDLTLDSADNQISYETIKSMSYLEMCVLETLRKYPILPLLNRECTQDYLIPESHLTIKKGTAIVISTVGLARDPKYFPDPMKYNPQRFDDEKENFTENAFVPFGEGPRACIGLRMGKLIAKIAIVSLLRRYKIDEIEKREMDFEDHGIVIIPKGKINLTITKRLDIGELKI